jgi:predicted nucleic acid-binding protein
MTARRAVIDTNVLISAALSPGGTAAAVTRWFIRHGRLIFSSETFAELESRLMRSKFDRYITSAIRLDVLRAEKGSAEKGSVPFVMKVDENMPNFRPKSERAPRALCWFAGSSVARAALS